MSDNYVTDSTDAPDTPPPPSLGTPELDPVPASFALGGRADPASQSLDIEFLRRATQSPSMVRGTSVGASDVLNEFLFETGYVYTVDRASFQDGHGHETGNALDVSGEDVGALVRFFRAVPYLFTVLSFTDPDQHEDENLYIVNGQIVSQSPLADEDDFVLHVETTLGRLGKYLGPEVVSGFVLASSGQFTLRQVFAVETPDIGGQVIGQAGALS